MAFSPDGDWLAVGSSLGDVLVYSTLENKLPRLHLCVDNDAFNAVAISSVEWKGFPWLAGSKIQQEFGPDSGIVAAFEDGHVRIATKAGFAYLRCNEMEIECLAISSGEEQLAASSGSTITVWTYQGPLDAWGKAFTIVETPPLRRSLECIIRRVAFTPDGERLVVGYMFHGIWYWNAKTGRRMKPMHSSPATRFGTIDVMFNGSLHPKAVIHNMRDGYDIYPLTGMTTLLADCQSERFTKLRPVVFGRDGSIVWGHCGNAGVLRAWSTKSGRIVGELDHGSWVCGLKHTTASSKRSILASLGHVPSPQPASTIRLWIYATSVQRQTCQTGSRSTASRPTILIFGIAVVAVVAYCVASLFRDFVSTEIVFLQQL